MEMMHHKRSVLRICVLASLLLGSSLLIAGCAPPTTLPTAPAGVTTAAPSGPTPPAPAVEVRIANFSFQPAEVQIKPGQAVRWTNQDSVQHTVTGSGFDSGLLSNGQQYQKVFNDVGSFDYHCSVHPQMLGKVIVAQ